MIPFFFNQTKIQMNLNSYGMHQVIKQVGIPRIFEIFQLQILLILKLIILSNFNNKILF